MWSVSSILSGLLSFMLESQATYGSIETDTDFKRKAGAARDSQTHPPLTIARSHLGRCGLTLLLHRARTQPPRH